MVPALLAMPPHAQPTEWSGWLDVDELHERMNKLLPRPDTYLSTPFTETVLLIERLRVAEVPIAIERRVFSPHSGQYTQVLGVRLGQRLFSARSCQPWEDYESWYARHQGRRIRWLSDHPISAEEAAEAMQAAEPEYARYRSATDLAIEASLRAAQRQHLDETTGQAGGQSGRSRL